ncbi:MAG: amino acid adenylation domain-containing protein, partial [Chitinophagaceae bacterium]
FYQVKPNDPVAIRLGRNEWLIIAILGILKSGGVYIPIDPDYPQERIDYIIEDCQCKIVIDEHELQLFDKQRARLSKKNAAITAGPLDVAYVIYTSGTTGKPKGVIAPHRAVVRLVKNVDYVVLTEGDRCLQTSSPTFDAMTFELWAMLLNGGALVLVDKEVLLNPVALQEKVRSNDVTTMWFTAPWFNQVVEAVPELFCSLKQIIVGGDKLSAAHINKALSANPSLKIINGYGPTENTAFSLTYLFTEKVQNTVPIGKPIANSTAFILDANKYALPVGATGELYVGGDGLALGYLNRPELTAEKFVDSPYEKAQKIYRTGDLARWLPDGNVEFIGRIDDQVKIRGFRIELGEIQNALQQCPLVSQCAVLTKDDAIGTKVLVAYVVPKESFNKEDLLKYLRSSLPDYMIPSMIMEIEQLPLTSNGKIDKKALPEPVSLLTNHEYIAPRNATEQALSVILKDLLRAGNLGIYDDLLESGLHSLLMIQFFNKINKGFQNVNIHLTDLMKNRSIEKLGILIDSRMTKENEGSNCIVKLRDGETGTATFIIPGMPGIAEAYFDLAQAIPGSGVVYGLQMKGVNAGEVPATSIEKMAAHNINLISRAGCGKEIRLYAHSYGGTIVYEMMKQLSDTGIAVKEIVLIDCYPIMKLSNIDKGAMQFFLKSLPLNKDIDLADVENKIELILKEPYTEWENLFANFFYAYLHIEKDLFKRLWVIVEQSLSIEYHYTDKLPYPATLVQAAMNNEHEISPVPMAWSNCFSSLTTVMSAANHFSIVKEPHCSEWISKLNINKKISV